MMLCLKEQSSLVIKGSWLVRKNKSGRNLSCGLQGSAVGSGVRQGLGAGSDDCRGSIFSRWPRCIVGVRVARLAHQQQAARPEMIEDLANLGGVYLEQFSACMKDPKWSEPDLSKRVSSPNLASLRSSSPPRLAFSRSRVSLMTRYGLGRI
jgi:hypothetical protein